MARRYRQPLAVALAVVLGTSLVVAGAVVVAKTFRGGSKADRIVGTNKADRLDGHSGDDTILGRGGRDVLRGGRGDDLVKGGRGKDKIRGQQGNDGLIGGPGNDTIFGGRGRDLINMTGDGEEIGGGGNDVIRARDGSLDEISCGPGRDKAIVDRAEDGVYDCETIVEPR